MNRKKKLTKLDVLLELREKLLDDREYRRLPIRLLLEINRRISTEKHSNNK